MSLTLYFRPMACSLASRIALYEADAEAEFRYVLPGLRTTDTGEDYLAVNPMGQVPALRLETGEVMTENAVVLQFMADRFAEARLAPAFGTQERYRMMTWMNFVTTELHAIVFHVFFNKGASEDVGAFALDQAKARLARLEFHLTGREWLVDSYSVADIYLYAVLNWIQVTPIQMSHYPALSAFMERIRQRPAVARAFAEEVQLYRSEQAKAA